MNKHFLDVANKMGVHGQKTGLILNTLQDTKLYGRTVRIREQEILNFTSCSYLGLELDPRLKESAKAAVDDYGVLLACSRSYLSVKLFEEAEDLLSQIFGHPTLLGPTTTLGHISYLPILVGEEDVIILDHQVHTSVRNTAMMVKGQIGVPVKLVRHSQVDRLEEMIVHLSKTYKKIWYLADGVYSMYGDLAPVYELRGLLEKHEQFNVYLDDAHGMSWTGEGGRGYVLQFGPLHPRMYMITSLGKGFGSVGGAMLFHNEEERELVRRCGSTMMFSGPVPPALLGATIAAAKIHLSPEINTLQKDLMDRILYFNQKAKEYGLPLVSTDLTPIRYIGVGRSEIGYEVSENLMKAGFYLSTVGFPAVPYNNCGLRVTLTRWHTYEDIDRLLYTMALELHKSLEHFEVSLENVFKAFKMTEILS